MRLPEKKKAIVIIAQAEWDLVWVFSHDLARHFIDQGDPVVYINPFPKRFPRFREWRRTFGRLLSGVGMRRFSHQPRPSGMHWITPFTFPDTHPFFTWINLHLSFPWLLRQVERCIPSGMERWVFLFLPFATPVEFAQKLRADRLVYACRSGWRDEPSAANAFSLEDKLLDIADLVVTAGPMLTERCQKYRDKTVEIPALVDFELFFRPLESRCLDRRICCYFGHVDQRIDTRLLKAIHERFRLRIIGKISVPLSKSDVPYEIMGQVSHEALPGLIAEMDVIVIPYRIDDFTRNIFPYKVFECFAQGKPVVITSLPTLTSLREYCYVASDREEFLGMIEMALGEPMALKQKRQDFARSHDREKVLFALEERLQEKMNRKMEGDE